MNSTQVIQELTIPLSVTIRLGVLEDLPDLEWFGMFTADREIIRSAYEAQHNGENPMLVAEANRFPVGQAWIDLTRKKEEGVGLLWAVRVIPWMQNLGIGTHLIAAAEQELRRRGFSFAELGVDANNPKAKNLYMRLGYDIFGQEHDEYACTPPDGVSQRIPVGGWILRKKLN